MQETDYKKNTRRVFWVWFILFFALIVWIAKYVFTDAPGVIISPYNRRMALVSERITRGDILDRHGEPLAQSFGTGRVYPLGEAMAHTVGVTGTYGFGIEHRYAIPLLTVRGELMARLNAAVFGDDVTGNTLVTTLDAGLNTLAYELLGGRKGAIIAIEPHTGKIIAMASSASFDPDNIAAEYTELAADDNLPLLNRVSRGLYPPGSVYKIVTLTAAIRHMADFSGFTFECAGSIDVDGRPLRCYNETAHGSVDIYTAFAVSCNGFFARLAQETGAAGLAETAGGLLFNAALPYPLEYNRSSHTLSASAGAAELAETAIGQGRTLATPLHMAVITAALANGGALCEPYIIDRITDASGNTVTRYQADKSVLFLPEETDVLVQAMRLAVTDGTASRMESEYMPAAKTGSAENPHGAEHGWVAAFAPYDAPQICVVVMFENCGGSSMTLEPAARMIKAALGGIY